MSRRHADEHGAYVVAVFPKPCPGLCDHYSCRDVRYRATVRQLETDRSVAPDATPSLRPSGHSFAAGVPPVLALRTAPVGVASHL